jgi:AraC family ethanolamine operon transcriptional activator
MQLSGGAQTTILAPTTFRFTDLDQFRSSIRTVDVDFTPLARKIDAEQIFLHLPGFDINVIKSFPRIIEARLAPNSTNIGFLMDEGVPMRVNGAESELPAITIGSHGAELTSVERAGRQFTSIIFTPAITDRGWPEATQYFKVFETSVHAQERLRQLVRYSLRAHQEFPDPLDANSAWLAIRESFLGTIDAAFADVVAAKWTSPASSARQLKIFRDIREVLATSLANPIYSSDLAARLGVSVRTIHDTVLRYTGMSLHRYLRLRRLWLVRRQLLAGAESVKAAALAFGFWHMGDFSHSYRMQFGERPSQTMARGRKV